MLQAYLVQWAWVFPGHGVACGMQDPVGCWMWGAGADTLGWVALLQAAMEAPGPGWEGEAPQCVRDLCSQVPASLADTIRANLNDWLFWSGENRTDIMWFWQSKPHWNLAFEYPRGWQQSQGLAGSPIEFTSNQLTAELDKLP